MSKPLISLMDCKQQDELVTDNPVMPLRKDLTDHSSTLTFTDSQTSTEYLSPKGFVGDGFSNKTKTTSIPGWMSSNNSDVLLQASITPHAITPYDSELVVGLLNGSDQAKISFTREIDGIFTPRSNISLTYYDGITEKKEILCRSNWYFRGRLPELEVNGEIGRPQAFVFVDSNHALLSTHYNDTLSRVFYIRLNDWKKVGYFDFPSPYNHVACASYDENGYLWMSEYLTGAVLRINLGDSLKTNMASWDIEYDMSAVPGVGLAFHTFNSVNYAVFTQYSTSGSPYMYLVTTDQLINGASFTIGDESKRFIIPIKSQGVAINDTYVYLAHGATGIQTTMYRFDTTELFSLSNNQTIVSSLSGTTRFAPSEYPEDIDIHPVTGNLWTTTEGNDSVIDKHSFLSAWETDFASETNFLEAPVENTYTAFLDTANNKIDVYINFRFFDSFTVSTPITPTTLAIGGYPAASAGWDTGFFNGWVRDVCVSPYLLKERFQRNIEDGRGYPSVSSETVNIPVPFHDAETGSVLDWTEPSTLGIRSLNPVPLQGTAYLMGGGTVLAEPYTDFDLETLSGHTSAELDAKDSTVVLEWYQSNYDGINDSLDVQLIFLNGSATILDTFSTGDTIVPTAFIWNRRSLSASRPAGAVKMRLKLVFKRDSGTNTDSYLDYLVCNMYIK